MKTFTANHIITFTDRLPCSQLQETHNV